MDNRTFEFIKNLQYQLKAVTAELNIFKSGEKYIRMESEYERVIRSLKKEIRDLKNELEKAHAQIVSIREQWFQVFEDMEKENNREQKHMEHALAAMEKRAVRAEKQRDDAKDKITAQRHELYEIKTVLEEEKGKNLKLRAQINRDYENSSLPSSMTVRRKKITNSREKSGRKPGAQPGHKGCGRKKQIPTTAPMLLPPPQEVLDDPDFKKTKKTIIKQKVSIKMILEVTEYHADVYYNPKTGERVHAAFPAGVVDDVNYDGSIRAFLFLLNNDCCVSIDKCRKLLSDMTHGQLNVSKGMISSLGREFARKTEKERKKTLQKMLLSPLMHTDCTNARENGKNAYVFVCATLDGDVLYSARQKKGHEGVKGTPAEDYFGILVHDHELTFYKYGTDHQECLAHVLRYLKDSIDNEPDRTWNKKMHTLIQEMIHYRNSLPADEDAEESIVADYENRYTDILDTARKEYEYIPASEYYREGYNLYIRMMEYRKNHLLFLHDRRVPATNNESERLLRAYKRKQRQAVSFRSFESIEILCECMSMLVMMRKKEMNIYDRVSEIFG